MKKITALFLALVLVFAFAGSALALTNRQPVTVVPSAASKVLLDLQIISYITGIPTTVGSVINWAAINSESAAYIEGQAIYFNCQLNQGAAAALTATDTISTQWKSFGGSLNIASTGVDLSLANISVWYTTSANVLSFAPFTPGGITAKTAAGFTAACAANNLDTMWIYNTTFNGVVTAASPVVTAKLTIGPGSEATLGTQYTVYGDVVNGAYPSAYIVTKTTATTYTVTNPAVTFAVIFTLKTEDGLLDNMQYDPDGAGAAMPVAVTRVVDVGGATHWAFAGTANTTYAANLDALLAFFGFDYALNGLIWDIDFLARANFVLTDTVNVKTATATINTGDDDDVPVTGDSTSVFGFVMIGVAILAAVSMAIVAKRAR